MAVIFDVLSIALDAGYWSEIALWMMIAGVVTLAFLCLLPFDFPQSGPHVARPSAWLHGRAGTST